MLLISNYLFDFQVLKLKPPTEKELFDQYVKCVEYSIWTDGYNWSFWKTGGGWGEVLRRYKPYKPKEKKEGDEEKKEKGKGKAPVKVTFITIFISSVLFVFLSIYFQNIWKTVMDFI